MRCFELYLREDNFEMTNTAKLFKKKTYIIPSLYPPTHSLNMVYYDIFSTFFSHASEIVGFMKVKMVTLLFTVIFPQFSRVRHIQIFVGYMNISKHLEIWVSLKSENGLDKSCSDRNFPSLL